MCMQRSNPVRHRDSVCIGCGAGFAGDRPRAALKLLKAVPDMNYLVLECLAERTLSNRFDALSSGGKGYDPRSKHPADIVDRDIFYCRVIFS
jgi:hypothetical protein